MPTTEYVWNALTHPIAAVTGAVASVASLAGVPMPVVDAVVATVVSQAGTLFSALSVSTAFIVPEIAWLPVAPFQVATFAVAALYIGVLLDTFWDSLEEKL